MKRISIKYPFFFFALVLPIIAEAQLTLPRTSQMATVTQQIGITEISITYSRPSVDNREVWGKLVPYGMNNLGFGTAKESPWRAGADENTVIQFSDDVVVEGQPLKAGTYGLHMIVHEGGNSATVIFSNNSTAWGSYFYDPSQDALRVDIQTAEIPYTEQLTFEFTDLGKTSAKAVLNWEKKQFPFKIEVDVTHVVLADIRKKLQGSPGFNRQTWEQAANYSLNNGGDLEEALLWIDNAIAGQFFSEKTFNNMKIKSQILLKMGKKEEALARVGEIADLANTDQLNNLGYWLLGIGENDSALNYFKLNVKNNPKNANVYDSLGEAYKIMGDKKNAIKNLKKSLSLNPTPNVKANSEKLLKELGAYEAK